MHGLHLCMEIIFHTIYKHNFQVRAWVNHNVLGICGVDVVEGDGDVVCNDEALRRAPS